MKIAMLVNCTTALIAGLAIINSVWIHIHTKVHLGLAVGIAIVGYGLSIIWWLQGRRAGKGVGNAL